MTGPFARFLKIEAAAGGLLLCVTIIALALANSPWSTQYLDLWETPIGLRWGQLDVSRSLLHWINDGLMTLFFFVIALELKRELVLGELRNPRAAALPFFAALGGMLVPVVIYISILDGQPGVTGWGTVMATDTAFVIGALALFGKAIPASLRIFLVSLAVFDDVGAIMVVAIAYGDTVDLGALALAVGCLSIVYFMARIGIRSIPMFFIVGFAVWLSFDASGLHATIAGVILGLMTPARAWVGDERMRTLLGKATDHPRGEHWSGNTTERSDLQTAGRAIEEALSPLERLEIMLLPWVGFAIMPVFALANAGVEFSGITLNEPVLLAIFAGLVIGKPFGVLLFCWIAVCLRLAKFGAGLDWGFLAAGAMLTGIGFTMSIFIADLAFVPTLIPAAKAGIFAASAAAAIAGLLMLLRRVVRKPATI